MPTAKRLGGIANNSLKKSLNRLFIDPGVFTGPEKISITPLGGWKVLSQTRVKFCFVGPCTELVRPGKFKLSLVRGFGPATVDTLKLRLALLF